MRQAAPTLILVTIVAFLVTLVTLTDPNQLDQLTYILGATAVISKRL